MEKKKLLFLNGHLRAGGCERSLVDLVRRLDDTKYEVDLLLLEGLGEFAPELPERVRVHFCPLNRAFGPFSACLQEAVERKDWFSLRFRLVYSMGKLAGKPWLRLAAGLFPQLSETYDAVIAYRPGICTELAAYAFRGKKKISWWHHGEFTLDAQQKRELSEAYGKMDRIVAVSESSAGLLRREFPAQIGKISVIPNMVCPEELERKAALPAEKLPEIDSGRPLLISMGRMSPEKNMTLCPEIGAELKKRGFPFRWLLVGDGEEREKIQARVRDCGLEKDFIFTGSLDNPYPYLKRADILVHPSPVESQGLTVLEAMALSVPVAAAESEGTREYIRNGENAYLIPPEPTRFAETIQAMWERRPMEELRRRGEEAAAAFAPSAILPAVEALLREPDGTARQRTESGGKRSMG